MKNTLHYLFVVLALLAGIQQASATVLLSDNFDNNLIDPAKWTTNITWNTSGNGISQVIATNQQVEFIDRGYLNTVTNYDPVASGGLLITGTWKIIYNNPTAGDAPTVATRSSGIPMPYNIGSGEVADGIRFKLQPPQNNFQLLILGTGGAIVTGYNQVSNTLSLAAGDTVSFAITDDGTNLTFNVTKVGNPTNSAYATAVSTSQLAANEISFYNREVDPDSSALDNVVVSTLGLSEPSDFTYTTNNGAITITGYNGTNPAVIIPATINGYPVTSIEANAFLYNSYPTNITIPSSVTSIGQTALFDCFNLISITVNSNNSFYSSVGGVLFDKSQQTLIQCPYGLAGNYTIPNGVITIGLDAFSDNPGLTSVTVPNSVTSIQAAAFFACTGLTNIIIGNSVTSIVGQAFGDCTSLQGVYFQGNAPATDLSVFQPQNNNTNTIAYYLPGTVGWGPTFDGIPTQILLPPPPALGVSTYGSQPAVFFPTATGTNYVLQMTTNLTPPINWVTVTNGVPISGLVITNPPPNAFFRLN